MLAIALVLDARRRQKTAAWKTLRDWAHRYNAEGVSGLFNRRPPEPWLSAAQKEELAEMVRGPRNRWGCALAAIDLKRKIEERFGVTMHERTVGKQLASLGFRRLSARPQHPKSARMHRRLLKKLRRRGRSSLAGNSPQQAPGDMVSG